MSNFTNQAILRQFDRLVSSRQLAASPVLREFLRFIIHETIAGRGNELKEYTIGVSALGKDAEFNPQLDGIVRIHAGRLRRALKEYYYEEGINDSLIISIPKGSYHAAFERRQDLPFRYSTAGRATNDQNNEREMLTEDIRSPDEVVSHLAPYDIQVAPSKDSRPILATLPFKAIGGDKALKNLAKGFCEFLTTELTRFGNLRIKSLYSISDIIKNPLDKRGKSLLDVDYVLTGSIQKVEDKMRMCIQLNENLTGNHLWAKTFDRNDVKETLLNFETRAVEETLAMIAGVHGVITRYETRKTTNGSHEDDFFGAGYQPHAYWYLRYARDFSHDTIHMAMDYYERLIHAEPGNAFALAFLSEIVAGDYVLSGGRPENLEKGVQYANKAILIDPTCQQAYQSLAINKLLLRHQDEAVHILEQGLEADPKSADYIAAMGALMIFAGAFEKGIKMLDNSMQINYPMIWWQTLSFSFYAYYRKFYHDALYWANRTEMKVLHVPVIKVASYAQLENFNEAKVILEEAQFQFPGTPIIDVRTVRDLFYSDELAEEVMTGLKKIELFLTADSGMKSLPN